MSLTKIANKEALSREDIIEAAVELDGIEKQAAEADAEGRELAHAYVEEMVKKAEDEAQAEAPAEAPAEGAEKTASSNEMQNAIAILKKYNVIK